MHYRMLVVFDKKQARNSTFAREFVKNWLDDNGFTAEPGRFSSPMADWFVIGGRWSGALTLAQLDKTKLDELWKEFREKELGWINGNDKKEGTQRAKTKELIKKYFPKLKGILPFPYFRDSYNDNGYEDDAQIVNEKIWDNLLAETVREDDVEHFCFIERDRDLTKENCVGKCWCVVVDYHN